MRYWLIVWCATCPFTHRLACETTKVLATPAWTDKNMIECPEHHIMLMARPASITENWAEPFDPPTDSDKLYLTTREMSKKWVKPEVELRLTYADTDPSPGTHLYDKENVKKNSK